MPIQEKVSQSVATDDHDLIVFVPAGGLADPAKPKLTELKALTAILLTYYFTSDGFTPDGDQDSSKDDRWTKAQSFEQPGKATDSLSTTYVTNPANPTQDVARVTLKQGVEGFFVQRPAVPHDDDLKAGDLVMVWPVKCGVQRFEKPESNSQWKITQKQFVVGEVQRLVPVVS